MLRAQILWAVFSKQQTKEPMRLSQRHKAAQGGGRWAGDSKAVSSGSNMELVLFCFPRAVGGVYFSLSICVQQIRVAQILSRTGLCGLHCDLYEPDSVSSSNVLLVFNFDFYFHLSVPAIRKRQT